MAAAETASKFSIGLWTVVAVAGLTAWDSNSQAVTAEDYQRAEAFLSTTTNALVYNANVEPHWMVDDRFWYANRTRIGTEYVLVDPGDASRSPLFDHEGMAESLSQVLEMEVTAGELPRLIQYSDGVLTFDEYGERVACDVVGLTCTLQSDDTNQVQNSILSPDGTHAAYIRDHNLWVVEISTGAELQLTTDGVEDYGYATNNAGWVRGRMPVLLWSPDSRMIATFQHDGRGVGEMYTVSTRVGHPKLDRWRYPLVGDSLIFRISRVVVHLDGPESGAPGYASRSPQKHYHRPCGGLGWALSGCAMEF